MLFFTSDVHFNDQSTIDSDLRPFKSTKQFDKFIIKTWNKQTTKNDTIYCIGDFVDCDNAQSDGWKIAIKYVKKLKAKVVLILGNNEERIIKYFFNNNFDEFKEYCLKLGFKDVEKNMIVKIRDKEFYCVHKPYDYNKAYLNLFGHVHASGGIYKPFGLNVGCDLYHFKLLSEDDIFHLLKKKEIYWDNCKHLNM